MFWVCGWVEVTICQGSDKEDEHAWRGVINLGALIDAPDTVSERLFGLSKERVAERAVAKTLAGGRGIPSNPSPEVRAELNRIKQHEHEYGPGECGGYTFATWQEVKAVDFDGEALGSSDWKLVFNLLQRLEQDHRFSDDQIRLVVWYNW